MNRKTDLAYKTINRTKVECKSIPGFCSVYSSFTINRTKVECKLIPLNPLRMVFLTINRTKVECKSYIIFHGISHCKPLIELKQNVNFIEFPNNSKRVSPLIELKQNVNFNFIPICFTFIVPLIELKQNVNFVEGIEWWSALIPINRTKVECKQLLVKHLLKLNRPLIELKQNVNIFISFVLVICSMPLIELKQNVNSLRVSYSKLGN